MNWYEITVKTISEAIEPISNILTELGSGGVMIEDPKDEIFSESFEGDWDYVESSIYEFEDDFAKVKAYFEREDIDSLVMVISERIQGLKSFDIEIGPGLVTSKVVEETDWSEQWKKHFKTFKIGDNVVIKPSWEHYESKDEEIVIEIDPGNAFGSGTHETTSMCIRLIDKYMEKGSKVYDIGTGSGILAIAAAHFGASDIEGVEIDEMAARTAERNVEINGFKDKIKIHHGSLTDCLEGKADFIVANIIADIIIMMSESVGDFIKKDSIFVSSGIIHAKIDEVCSALENNGFEVLEVWKEGEWSAIASRKK